MPGAPFVASMLLVLDVFIYCSRCVFRASMRFHLPRSQIETLRISEDSRRGPARGISKLLECKKRRQRQNKKRHAEPHSWCGTWQASTAHLAWQAPKMFKDPLPAAWDTKGSKERQRAFVTSGNILGILSFTWQLAPVGRGKMLEGGCRCEQGNGGRLYLSLFFRGYNFRYLIKLPIPPYIPLQPLRKHWCPPGKNQGLLPIEHLSQVSLPTSSVTG